MLLIFNNEQINIEFIHGTEKYNRNYTFETSIIVKEMIEKYLRDTNSVINYSIDAIHFRCNNIILNKETNLNKPLSGALKPSLLRAKNAKILVLETKDIIGGYYKINQFIFNFN